MRRRLESGGSITEAIYEAGYGSQGRFYEKADAILGMTPRQYRGGGDRARIRFALGQCSLGAILVGMSERGVCAVSLGDDPAKLLREFQDRFPRAELVGDDARFQRKVAQVVARIESPDSRRAPLPLDVHGTAFQQRVWRALQRIPAGRTMTYAQIARQMRKPRAVRAVAGACAANPLAVLIPCHRVVRADGLPSGYRWGLARKRELLDRESPAARRP
ncbi:MAG: methylated-DNA--[protein]-cysteine S-methyltransferase [Steroidobacteraceae bacterium]